MKITDLKGLLKKSYVTIESIENPFEDYYVIKLKTEPNITWEPGEHGIFRLPGKYIQGRKWRAFSVASIQEEGLMILATRIGSTASSFKKELIAMKKGEKVAVTGPFGWFKLKDDISPLVLFAGGIGITPIRALLKSLENNTNRAIEVIYATDKFYLFSDEIETMASKNSKIIIHKTVNKEETKQIFEQLTNQYGNKAYYYNSGSPNTLKAIREQLKGKGIKSNRIIADLFL